MKSILNLVLITISLSISYSVSAQITASEQKQIDSIIKTLPPLAKPSDMDLGKLCYQVGKGDAKVLILIKTMSGVLAGDNELIIKAKVQRFWNLYYEYFGCDTLGFATEYGNILKFAIHNSYNTFIDSMVSNFLIDINKIDPSDGKTLLDFVKEEINRYGAMPEQNSRVEELKTIYKHLRNDLGAKHASELK